MNLKAEELWKSIFDNSFFYILVVNREGLILDLNHAAEAFDKKDIIGKMKLMDFLPEEQKQTPLKALEAIFEKGEAAWTYETDLPQGYSFRTTLSPVVENGKIIAALAMSREISEEKKIMESMIHSARLASVGELATGIGHEINNPLSVLRNSLELVNIRMKGLGIKDEAINDFINKGEAAADKIEKIISSLKTVGMTNTVMEAISLGNSVREAVNLFQNIFPFKGIKLEMEFDSEDDFVYADKGKIQQIVLFLAENARDALAKSSGAVIRFSTAVRGGNVLLMVRDNGGGVSQKNREKIKSSSFSAKLQGIGLSVCQTLAREMGGTVEFSSVEGEGTEFKVSFPSLNKMEDSRSFSRVSGFELDYHGKVLVVDDEPDIAEVMMDTLELLGVEVVALTSSTEALERLKTENFDLLISDNFMPDMSGSDLIRKADKMERSPSRYILMSGRVSDSDLFTSNDFDRNKLAFLQKPIGVRKLADTLKKFLNN